MRLSKHDTELNANKTSKCQHAHIYYTKLLSNFELEYQTQSFDLQIQSEILEFSLDQSRRQITVA